MAEQKFWCLIYPAFVMDQRASPSAKVILLEDSDMKSGLCKSRCRRHATDSCAFAVVSEGPFICCVYIPIMIADFFAVMFGMGVEVGDLHVKEIIV